jgi:methylmalonyl-CoA/ethylmalonyl-CoA epimerase
VTDPRPGGEAVFDHVAHAAPRIRDLLDLYAVQLGGRPLYGGSNLRVGYRAITIGFAAGRKFELMEPVAGSGFFDSFFARSPAGGLHHVTFRVADVREAVTGARAAGYEVIGEFYEDERWQEAFIHPRGAHGVLVQYVQAPDDYPTVDPDVTFDRLLASIGSPAPA